MQKTKLRNSDFQNSLISMVFVQMYMKYYFTAYDVIQNCKFIASFQLITNKPAARTPVVNRKKTQVSRLRRFCMHTYLVTIKRMLAASGVSSLFNDYTLFIPLKKTLYTSSFSWFEI